MFVVGSVWVEDAVAQARFCCALGACLGACCVQGEAGAPLTPDECATLERVVPAVRSLLQPEALDVIDAVGAWEEGAPGAYQTPCVGGGACVYVSYEGSIALCGLQKAHQDGQIAFPKPISCHLYPLRVGRTRAGQELLRYERIRCCAPARSTGVRQGTWLSDFLEDPLTRRYGAAWYAQFQDACRRHRSAAR